MAPEQYLTINVGGAGCQLGDLITHQYMKEHGIQDDGSKREDGNDQVKSFFEETGKGTFTPRSIFVDTDPNSVDAIRSCKAYHPEFLLSGKEDAGSNFAAGRNTTGKELLDQVNDRLRKMVDNCDNVQGFIINHSVSGGTGAGLGTLILERIAKDYRKKLKLGMHIYGSEGFSPIVAPYNAMLATHYLLDLADMSMVFDNAALRDICKNKLDVANPTMQNLNYVVARAVSGITSRVRFPNGEGLHELQYTLVPFPRLHFLTCSLAPLMTAKSYDSRGLSVSTLVRSALEPDSMLVKYPNYSPEDKYLALSLNFRGKIQKWDPRKEAQRIQKDYGDRFVDWVPSGGVLFTVTEGSPADAPIMAAGNEDLVAVANNSAVKDFFRERISKKFDLMYSKRAYVHLYVGEGMDEGEFSEARQNLGSLEQDYLDVTSEGAGEVEDDEFLLEKKTQGKLDKRVQQHKAAQPH